MGNKFDQITDYARNLAEDARALLAATSDVAGDRVTEARRRLSHALENGRDVLEQARRKAADGVRYADDAVRENPYTIIAAALLIGGLITWLLTGSCCRKKQR